MILKIYSGELTTCREILCKNLVIICDNKLNENYWITLYSMKKNKLPKMRKKNEIFYATSIISFSQACHYIL